MAVNNSLAKQQNKKMDFGMYLTQDAAKQQINKLLGGQAGTRFISSIVSAVQANPALQECTNSSVLSAALQGEALKLSPSPQLGQFYMVPFNNRKNKTKEAQFQLGYKGYIQLAKRSGVYKKLHVISIKEGELISYNPLEEELEVALIEDDLLREATPTIGYYAMFREHNGYEHSMYWSKKKMMAHADRYSAAFNAKDLERLEKGEIPEKDLWKYSSFWYKDFDAMAHKTMLRQLISKWGTMSIEMVQAINADMAVLQEDGTADYVEREETPKDDVVAEQESEAPNEKTQVQELAEASEVSVENDFFNQ